MTDNKALPSEKDFSSKRTLIPPALLSKEDLKKYGDTMPSFLEGSIFKVKDEIIKALHEKQNDNQDKLSKIGERIVADSSLIVGIEGHWGNGKTSSTNLLLEQLYESGIKGKIMFFAAWDSIDNKEYTLTQRILMELSKVKFEGKKPFTEFLELETGLVEKKKGFLNLSLFPLVTFASVILTIIIGFLNILGILLLPRPSFLQSEEVVFLIQTCALVLVIALGYFIYTWMKSKTLTPSEASYVLFRKFSDLKVENTVIIVIDDIDRLSRDELPSLLRMVRNTINFPNIMYLLPYSSKAVFKALEANGFYGEEYFRKMLDLNYHLTFPTLINLNENIGRVLKKDLPFPSYYFPIPDESTELQLQTSKIDFSIYPFNLINHLSNRRDYILLIKKLEYLRVTQVTSPFLKFIYENEQYESLFLLEYLRDTNPSLWGSLSKYRKYLTYPLLEEKVKEGSEGYDLETIKNLYDVFYFLREAKPEEKLIIGYIFPWLKYYSMSQKPEMAEEITKKILKNNSVSTDYTNVSYKTSLEYSKEIKKTLAILQENTENFKNLQYPLFEYETIVESYFESVSPPDFNYTEKIALVYDRITKIITGTGKLNNKYSHNFESETEQSDLKTIFKTLTINDLTTILNMMEPGVFDLKSQYIVLKSAYDKASSDLRGKKVTLVEKTDLYRKLRRNIQEWSYYYQSIYSLEDKTIAKFWIEASNDSNIQIQVLISLAFGGKNVSWTGKGQPPESYSHGWNSRSLKFAPDLQELFENITSEKFIYQVKEDPLASFIIHFWTHWVASNKNKEEILLIINLMLAPKNKSIIVNHGDAILESFCYLNPDYNPKEAYDKENNSQYLKYTNVFDNWLIAGSDRVEMMLALIKKNYSPAIGEEEKVSKRIEFLVAQVNNFSSKQS